VAHRSKVLYWQCMSEAYGKWQAERWLLWDGYPDDEGSQVLMDFTDSDYRQFFKGLPSFKDDAIFVGRMAFEKAKAPKRGKLRADLQEDLDLAAEEKDGPKDKPVSKRKRTSNKTSTKRSKSVGTTIIPSEDD